MLSVSGLWIPVSLVGLSSRLQDHHSDKERQDWFLDGGKSIDQYTRHFKNAGRILGYPELLVQHIVRLGRYPQTTSDGKFEGPADGTT